MEYQKPESYFKETTASSELIFDGKVLHLYRDEINLPDGGKSFREYCKHNGAVCVVPLTREGEVAKGPMSMRLSVVYPVSSRSSRRAASR